MAPTLEKMLRTKLLAATPEEARRGMNSVSMVVATAKMSMLPMPKKKLARSCGRGRKEVVSYCLSEQGDRMVEGGSIILD